MVGPVDVKQKEMSQLDATLTRVPLILTFDLEFSRKNCISRMGLQGQIWNLLYLSQNGSIATKRKANISIQILASNRVFDLGHDFDLEISRSNMEFAISQPKMVRLPRTKSKHINSNLNLKLDHRVWPWLWPWPRIFVVKYGIWYISELKMV